MNRLEKILHYFPEVDLPVMVSEEHLREFEDMSDPFPLVFVEEVLLDWEKDADDCTEFIPCFRLPKAERFDAVVYWKGGLLRYDFMLVTLDRQGTVISKRSIAGTLVQGDTISRMVASIEADLTVNIIAGQSGVTDDDYDGTRSKVYSLEILEGGEIIFTGDEV